jgi:hypothetical protein
MQKRKYLGREFNRSTRMVLIDSPKSDSRYI